MNILGEDTPMILAAVIGGVLGALVTWMFARARIRALAETASAARDAEVALMHAERNAASDRHDALVREAAAMMTQLEAQRIRVLALSEERSVLAGRLERLSRAEAELEHSRAELRAVTDARASAEQKASVLDTRLHEHMLAAQDKIGLLERVREEFTDKFKALAGDLLEEKSKRFTAQNETNIGNLLNPLREQIGDFRKLVSESYEKENNARVALQTELKSELKQLLDLNHKLGDEANNLTRALKNDSRSQGAWGEMILERLLEMAGLQSGRHFETQTSFQAADGSRQRPDVIVRLPDEKDIVVDAKVSLIAWNTFVSSADAATRATAMRDHLTSLRRHIDGIAAKDYSSLPSLRTLDFVLIFVPIEAAFVEAVCADDSLYGYALAKNVSLVSPSTLLATLRTVRHLWRIDQRNLNALEFEKVAIQLHDNFSALITSIEDVGDKLDRAKFSHDTLLRRLTEGGRGSVLLQVQRLKELGAQTRKTLSRELLDRAGAGADSEVAANDAPGDATIAQLPSTGFFPTNPD